MSLISDKSPVTALSEYDLFGLPPVQTTVESTIQSEHRPISVLNSGGNIEFVITTGVNEYIIPSDTLLYIKLRVNLTKTDKSEIVSNDWNSVSVVNNLLNSLWQQIDVSIGDTQATTSLQTSAWKSYFENLIGFSDDSKKSYMSGLGWFTDEISDTPHKPNSLRSIYIKHITPDGLNAAEDKEQGKGRILDLYGKINFDLAFQGRAILGGTKIRFKLVPNPTEFYLMCSDENIVPKVEFIEIALNIVRAKLNPEIVSAHDKALQITPARYPFTRSDVRTTTITDGTLNITLENVINGQLPRRCFIAFVSNEAFNGSLKKNPFCFHHYDINYLACYLNGDQYPRRAFQPDFESGLYMREYIEFYRAANQNLTDSHLTISRANYAKGSTIFGFNFAPDLSDGCGCNGYISQGKHGMMRIEIHFKKPLSETINALIFSEFDSLLMIPEDRNAITDYH
jgi:hypothetical protein